MIVQSDLTISEVILKLSEKTSIPSHFLALSADRINAIEGIVVLKDISN